MATPNYKLVVERIKARLIAERLIPVPQTTHEHALLITAVTAIETGGMLHIKENQTGAGAKVNGIVYSSDVIDYPDGWADCLASGGPPANENRPIWDWHDKPSPASQMADPRPIAQALTHTVDVPPPPPPPPPNGGGSPPSTEQLAQLVAALLQFNAEAKQMVDTMKLAVDELTAMQASLRAIAQLEAGGMTGKVAGYLNVDLMPRALTKELAETLVRTID